MICPSSCYLKRKHVQHEHEKKKFVCDQCEKCFSIKADLDRHILTHLPVKARKYQCNICQKKFTQNSHLTEHKRIHSGVRPYKCEVCSLSFRFSKSMKRHRMLKHFKNEDKHAKNTLPKNTV
ncbi:PREDICTED: zinc finger protein 525-like [Wasmannia auropunctata]|uniref:zinc finger protein 525-like n=1 Tax=Wasmannia auropunctata TaxID=64793 RepID=UPI0005EF4457|nr:PREDICTED: zinc finger protein 525-like [Wasmannia auropunctata]